MKTEQQKQAESLYFQTDLSKTEIANMVGVSRRTLHYWVSQNHWDAIRQHAQIMPTVLAGNCYLILARFQESLTASDRVGPATQQEVNTMHRLIMSINKLTQRATLNESLEMMTHFMEFANALDPCLDDILRPVVDAYIRRRAGEASMLVGAAQATPPITDKNETEEGLDRKDVGSWAAHKGNDGATSTSRKHAEPATDPALVSKPLPAATTSVPVPPHPHTKVTGSGQILKGKANNRAARRAQAQAAARQARAA